MKIIDDDKVFITKDAINRIGAEVGARDDSPIVSRDIYIKIADQVMFGGGILYGSRHADELVEIADKEASEFVKNADWILDYSKYESASLEDIENEFYKIASIYNLKVGKTKMLLNSIVDPDKRDAEYKKMWEEMAPLNFILDDLRECNNRRQKEIEEANAIEETVPTSGKVASNTIEETPSSNGKVAFIRAKTKKMTLREQLKNMFNRNK